MSVTVRVPTTLRTLTGGAAEVAVEGATVGDVLAASRPSTRASPSASSTTRAACAAS